MHHTVWWQTYLQWRWLFLMKSDIYCRWLNFARDNFRFHVWGAAGSETSTNRTAIHETLISHPLVNKWKIWPSSIGNNLFKFNKCSCRIPVFYGYILIEKSLSFWSVLNPKVRTKPFSPPKGEKKRGLVSMRPQLCLLYRYIAIIVHHSVDWR